MGKTLVTLHKALWMPVPTRKTQFRTRETVSRPPDGETSAMQQRQLGFTAQARRDRSVGRK